MQFPMCQLEDIYWIFGAVLLIVMGFKLGTLITSVFTKTGDVLFAL